MNKHYFGIDCGINGAIVDIGVDGKNPKSVAMPTLIENGKKKHDLFAISQFFKRVSVDFQSNYKARPFFIVEDPGHHAPSASGLRSMTLSFAYIEACIVCCQLSYETVSSRSWQKSFWNKKEAVEIGEEYNTKKMASRAARSIWPDFDFRKNERSRIDHDGIVDAALIAEYGRRHNL